MGTPTPPPPEINHTYAEINDIFKKIGVNDPEKLSDSDLESLSQYAGTNLTPDELTMYKQVRDCNKTYKKLPVPTIPGLPSLSKEQLANMPEMSMDTRLALIQGNIEGAGCQPIDFASMSAADWMKVIVDCNLIYARIFNKLGKDLTDIPQDPMFFPPNKSMFGTPDFKVAQEGIAYHQKSELAENFDDKTVMGNFTAGGSFSSPWVSGSTQYSHATQNRTAAAKSSVTSVFKIWCPVGVFTLPRPCEVNDQSTMKINDDFGDFVKNYVDNNPDCKRNEVVDEMTRRFGDVVPRMVYVGVACYTTDTQEMTEAKSLESVSSSMKESVSAGFGCFGASENSGKSSENDNSGGDKNQQRSYAFAAIGGSLPQPSNPMSIANYRTIPCSWRVIHMGDEFTPVYDYLSKDAKDMLNKSKRVFNDFFIL